MSALETKATEQIEAAESMPDGQSFLYGRRGWTKRIFGEVHPRTMPEPSRHPDGSGRPDGLNRANTTERGFAVGITSIMSPPAAVVAGRWSQGLGSGRLPKTMFEASTLVVPGDRAQGELSASVWYPLDVLTKILVGVQTRAELGAWDRAIGSPFIGAEFHVGRWRVRPDALNGRQNSWVNFKLLYLFAP